MLYFYLLGTVLRSMLLPAADLRLENLALRQQLAILKPKNKRPRLRVRDRWFWVLALSKYSYACQTGNLARGVGWTCPVWCLYGFGVTFRYV